MSRATTDKDDSSTWVVGFVNPQNVSFRRSLYGDQFISIIKLVDKSKYLSRVRLS